MKATLEFDLNCEHQKSLYNKYLQAEKYYDLIAEIKERIIATNKEMKENESCREYREAVLSNLSDEIFDKIRACEVYEEFFTKECRE